MVKTADHITSRSTSVINKKAADKMAFFQAKLTVNEPGDQYEQEADAVAEKVMRMPANGMDAHFFKPNPVPVSSVQRKCAHCEEEEKIQREEMNEEEGAVQMNPITDLPVQRKCAACESLDQQIHRKNASVNIAPAVSPIVHQTLQSQGQPLERSTRAFMELRFGYDFGNVQIHNDLLAHQSSKEINALAYTHGNHVAFGEGQYQPNTKSGKQLLAHELVHVIQQNRNSGTGIQRRTDAFGKECPDTAEIGAKKPIPPFNKAMYDAGFRTYFGLITDMKVGPKNSYEACITEVLMVEENTCGETGNMANYDPCGKKDHCLPINSGSGGDILTQTTFPAAPNMFIDMHRTERPNSLLSGTGKNECRVKCLQRYGCGGKEIGRFHITRNFRLSEYQDGTTKVPITIGSIEKEPARR